MERKRRIKLGNEDVEATQVPFQVGGEHWNEYLCDDGSVLRMKVVTTEIFRVDGRYDNEGNPTYVVKSTNVLTVSAPDKLRRQGA